MADRPKGVSPDAGTWSRLATLPPGGIGDDERLRARRSVARDSMLRRHGCPGRQCAHRSHAADRAVMYLLLDVLGLAGEQR